jgi:hypothetical protein
VIRTAAAFALSLALFPVSPDPETRGQDRTWTKEQREDAIKRAKVWTPVNVAGMNIKAGPEGPLAFAAGQTVTCDYKNRPKGDGSTPKFHCTLPSGRNLKVRYGKDNGEVYAHVAATRLFWALGYPANAMYPVKVICRGCPADPFENQAPPPAGSEPVVFDPATIDEDVDGETIESRSDEGWAWRDLALVDEKSGGASIAERDALRLLVAFVQHTSNKALNQRIVCLDKPACKDVRMVVNDLGKTFGRSRSQHDDERAAVHLTEWAGTPIWKGANVCVANLHWTWNGSLSDPLVGEAGRKLLADQLNKLSDAQIRDLFVVARFTDRNPAWPVEQWVAAFKAKRTELTSRTCPK